MQTPAVSLPSAARGCWLAGFCRAALRCFKEFPHLCSLERINPMAGESQRGLPAASPSLRRGTNRQSPARVCCLAHPQPRAPRPQQPRGAQLCHAGERMLSPLPVPQPTRRQVRCGGVEWACWGERAEARPWASPHPRAGSSP